MSSNAQTAKDKSFEWYRFLVMVFGGCVTAGVGLGTYVVKNSTLQRDYDQQTGELKQVTAEYNDAQKKLTDAERTNVVLQQKLEDGSKAQLSAQLSQCMGRLSSYEANDPILGKIKDVEDRMEKVNDNINYRRIWSPFGSSSVDADTLADMRIQTKQYQTEIDDLSRALQCEPK